MFIVVCFSGKFRLCIMDDGLWWYQSLGFNTHYEAVESKRAWEEFIKD